MSGTDIPLFTDDWYHKIMYQFEHSIPDAGSSDSAIVARAIVLAGALVSQAIDNAFGHSHEVDNTQSAITEVAAAIERIAEVQEQQIEKEEGP